MIHSISLSASRDTRGEITDDSARRNKLVRLCQVQLIAMLALCRFAVSFGDKQIQVTWIIGTIFFIVIGSTTRWAVSLSRLCAMGAVFLVIVAETLAVHDEFSPLSIFYVFGTYLPLCLALPGLGQEDLRRVWRTFVTMTIVLAACGFVQVGLQFVFRSDFFDPITLLPEACRLAGYPLRRPASIGAFAYICPNGLFALEPSFFSQFVALGLVGEMQFFRRKPVILFLFGALLASFSGTGVLILVLSIPFTRQSPKWIMVALTVGLAWYFVVGDSVLSFYTNRLSELNRPGESGNARFVYPYQVMSTVWENSRKDELYGIGAGQSSVMNTIFEANFPPVAKVGIEFGLLGLGAFAALWVTMYFRLQLSPSMTAALWVFYFVASGSLLHPPTVFPLWSLSLGFVRKRPQPTGSKMFHASSEAVAA